MDFYTGGIINCVFEYGAAISCYGPVSISNCLFFDNSGDTAGAIHCSVSSDYPASIVECVFIQNHANEIAAIHAAGPVIIARCTFVDNDRARPAIRASGNNDHVRNCIFAFGGTAVTCFASAEPPNLSCCNIYGNTGGDWVGCIADQNGESGNISEDPLFCSSTPNEDRNWTLQVNSPCAPGNHPDQFNCGLIGAEPVECTSPVEPSTWGAVKAHYR
jgi:hypothetical protein